MVSLVWRNWSIPSLAELAAGSRHLASAKGSCVVVEKGGCIDPRHARLDLVDRPHGLGEIVREDEGAEPVARVVGVLEGLIEAADPADWHDRPEALVVHDLHVRGAVGENGRIAIVAAIETFRTAAAGDHACTLVDGARKHALVAVTLPLGRHRSHVHLVETIADAQPARQARDLVDKAVVHGHRGRRSAPRRRTPVRN